MRLRVWMVLAGSALASSSYAQGFSAWSGAVTDGGNVSVSANAAMAGTAFGMEVFVNNQTDKYVFDETPVDEPRYRVRFYLDTNGYLPGLANEDRRARVLLGFDTSPTVTRSLTVVLIRLGATGSGQYLMFFRARRNDGTFADSAFLPVSDGVHVIEVDWQRATTPAGTDGQVRIWIDGGASEGPPTAVISNIANGNAGVDRTWMGTINIKPNASGTLYFDEFESRRQTYIGPVVP
jgi:hypothetical protein